MTSDLDNDWERLSPLLDQALELGSEAREAWLAQLAASKPGLASVLRELLAEKDQLDASRFLEYSPAGAFGPATLAGQRIAAYEIERLIGQGGMGAVWLAHRCDGRFEGRAAVKLLNASLIGGPAEQRFVREGSVLAALQHPNIAHLIDAGVSGGRQPYLILEYIEGSSVADYCDEHRLGIRARIRVFLEILEAVAFAHRHLVVHRDLKPSNILVTKDGVVKLLDFGIAALLEPTTGANGCPELTLEIGAALTPEYAAPEQVMGQPVTTATDIYALGRVLFVLLGGGNAAVPEDPSARRDALERESPLLSDVAVGEGTRRLLRGDLDNIVRKALKSQPSERYATVEAFAADLRHHLANEPVSARPDSFGYRAGKFIRRHRGGVLSATVTALALVAVTAFALSQMVEARHQRDEAEAQWNRAQGYAMAITSLLSQAGPGGRPLTPVELLERAAEQVEATYADDPALLVDMLVRISGRYFDLQDTNREYATLVSAERVARASGNPLLLFKVQCNTVETELGAGRRADAERRLDEALGLLPSIPEVPVMDHVSCLRARSHISRADGDIANALIYLEEARRELETNERTDSNVYAGILSMLTLYNRQAGNVLAAHDYTLARIELDRRLGRENSMSAQISRVSLAISFENLGELRRAESIHRQVAAGGSPGGAEKMLLGRVLTRLERHEEAIGLIRESIAEFDELGYHPYRIRARLALAESFFHAGRLAEAGPALEDAVILMRQDEVQYRQLLVDGQRLRAEILLSEGQAAEAASEIAAALRLYQATGHSGPRMGRILLTQARVGLAQREPARAAGFARDAVHLFEQNTLDPTQSADLGEALFVLAQADFARGDTAASLRSLDRATVSLRNGLGADHSLTRSAEHLAPETSR